MAGRKSTKGKMTIGKESAKGKAAISKESAKGKAAISKVVGKSKVEMNKDNVMQKSIEEIRNELLLLSDSGYRDFHAKLMPTIDKEKIIGIRTPVLRRYGKELLKSGGYDDFLKDLPHKFYEENNLHVILISAIKDYDECLERYKDFLKYIDNWATCDYPAPKAFEKNKDKIFGEICKWIKSDEIYTVRFAIGLLMRLFLDDDYDEKYADMVAKVRSEEYYVNMMSAWYFATALAKQYDSAIKYIEKNKLDKWTHNMTIRKACESFRVSKEQKEYLKTLKI